MTFEGGLRLIQVAVLSACILGFMALLTIRAHAEVEVPGEGITRVLTTGGGMLRTQSIINFLSGTLVETDGPEFILTFDRGQKTTSDVFEVVSLDSSNKEVIAVLYSTLLELRAEIRYTAVENTPWLYKQIVFTNLSSESFLLRTVEVEHIAIENEEITYSVDPRFATLGDWGQPVYTESLFFGLEFPAAWTGAESGKTVFLRHHPGIELEPGQSYTTKRAVVGAAPSGRVTEAFMEYVCALTPDGNPPDANLYWNGFRVIKPPDRIAQGLEMVEYAKKLYDETGFAFEAWTYDAGFDMYRTDALFVPDETEIWDKTAESLESTGTPVGMWTSFSCIYDTATHEWGKTQGYELQHDSSYCLAGSVYYEAIKNRLEELVEKYDMGSINFDGMYWGQGFGCNRTGHGHLVGTGSEEGVYATERVVENMLEIFASLRNINPSSVLDLFVCNEWASPWWLTQLDGVHTVVGDTIGCDIPSPWLRDELITVRDIQVFYEHRQLERQFPLWAEDLYGTQVRNDHLIDGVTVKGEDMAARWEDEYVMAYPGRGAINSSIMCSDLTVLDRSRGGLKFLGEVANWVKSNKHIYRDFYLLGGNPSRREAYGYRHSDGAGRSLVALRNPWIEPVNFTIDIDESLGLGKTDERVFVNVVYPYRKTYQPVHYGESVDMLLRDYDVILLEVRTESRQFAEVPGGERWNVTNSGQVMVYDEAPLKTLPSGEIIAIKKPGETMVSGTVFVPQSSAGGQLQLMLRPDEQGVKSPTVLVNGETAEFEFHERYRQNGSDFWLLVDVPLGNSTIEIIIPSRGLMHLGAWLVATYSLDGNGVAKYVADDLELFPYSHPMKIDV